ncbi:hypothetical protein JL722_5773 [Aureococcus anophagefferens]|nr:hypothetical protein JL722_5773 [Aureococcus anophagefferens]
MPWVLDDDVALRERERRLDDAYHTRRWPYTDGRRRFADGDDDAYGTATDDDDDALLHRGYGLPRQSGDVVVENHVHHARPGAASCAAGPRRSAGAAATSAASADQRRRTVWRRRTRRATSATSRSWTTSTRLRPLRCDAERHVEVPGRARGGGCGEGRAAVAGAVPRRRRSRGTASPPRDRASAAARRRSPTGPGRTATTSPSRTPRTFRRRRPLPTYDFTPRCRAPAYGHRAPPASRGACGYDVGRAPSYAARASYADWAGSGFTAGVPAYASDLRF